MLRKTNGIESTHCRIPAGLALVNALPYIHKYNACNMSCPAAAGQLFIETWVHSADMPLWGTTQLRSLNDYSLTEIEIERMWVHGSRKCQEGGGG